MGIVPRLKDDVWCFTDPRAAECGAVKVPGGASRLTDGQQEQLHHLAQRYLGEEDVILGCAVGVHHKIDTGDHPPIKQRYYPVSPAVQAQISGELDEMIAQGVVEKSQSPWSSPVVLVRKRDGSLRFCVDFRKVNAVTKRDAYPLPYVSSILDRLRNARYLSSLDIKSAYWQIPLDEGSKEKTAFTVPGRGLYQFRRMPFGLHNAPATWQRLIDNVLGADLEPYVFVYLDDIVVATPEFASHLEVLAEVFKRLRLAGLTLNKEKCQLGRQELRYLGYIVDQSGLRVDPEKVSAILNYPAPKTVKQVRAFVGLASWYRRFIPDFSSRLAPLTRLLRRGRRWEWSEEEERAFCDIKSKLVEAPILSCPDFSKAFIIQTDASTVGLGAILSQELEDGEKVVAYASRTLSKAEQRYSATELECLAVVWAIEKFRAYVEGSPFVVITDHHALQWLHKIQDPSGRLARWALRLQQYDFVIRHRPGRDNLAADALSRVALGAISADMRAAIEADPWYRKMRREVTAAPQRFPLWRVTEGRLYKNISSRNPLKNEDPWKLVVPQAAREEVLRELHDEPTAGHLGVYKTIKRVTRAHYWPGYARDVATYVRQCDVCQSLKSEQKPPAGLMGQQRVVTRPWQMISTDLMGPLPLSSQQNRFLLVIADYFTKYAVLVPLRKATASAVVRHLEEDVFLVFGVPQWVICDNGKQFVGREMKAMLAKHGTRLLLNPVYHPQANPTERINRVLKTMLASYVKDNQRTWDRHVPEIGFALRTATHEVTGYTPAYMNFGREPVRHASEYPTAAETEDPAAPLISRVGDPGNRLETIWEDVVDRLQRAYEANARHYNLRRRPADFGADQPVWVRTHPVTVASQYYSAKLAPVFERAIIKRRISPLVYEVVSVTGKPLGKRHVKDIKPRFGGEVRTAGV